MVENSSAFAQLGPGGERQTGWRIVLMCSRASARFSAAVGSPFTGVDPTGYDAEAINNGTKLLRVYVGNVTDFVHPLTMATMAAFEPDRRAVRVRRGSSRGPHG